MLTEVMRYYRLAKPPVDLGLFETEHHLQTMAVVRENIMAGRLIALTAVIGSGKSLLFRHFREMLEREKKVIVSRAVTLEKSKIIVPLLVSALFYDLSPEKQPKIAKQAERRERDLQELFRKAKKPVALFVDDAHDLHGNTLKALKRLVELVQDGGGQLAVVMIGHPRLKNDLRRPNMEEVGDHTEIFEFGGLRDRQRDFLDWTLSRALEDGAVASEVITEEAVGLLAAKLKTPLQLSRYLIRAFEAGFEMGAKPLDATVVEGVLSQRFDDLEPQLNRHGYDLKTLCEQFDAKTAEIRKLMKGELQGERGGELVDEMRAAGLPV